MLRIYSQALFDACSYFYFLQASGAKGQHEMTSGRILFCDASLPNDWPSPLFKWSVLLANEAAPCFRFNQKVQIRFDGQEWLALQAHATPGLVRFMEQFGWNTLPVCLLAPIAHGNTPIAGNLRDVDLYASCKQLQIETHADGHLLELDFAAVHTTPVNVTSVTQHSL